MAWQDSLQSLQLPQTVVLLVSTEEAILRQEPLLSAPESRRLKKGDSLYFSGQLTRYTLQMRLQGLPYNEPWLEAYLPNTDQKFWIYGGCVRFLNLPPGLLQELTLERRLRQSFSDNLTKQLLVYQKEMSQVQTLNAWRMLWRRGNDLRDSLETQLQRQLGSLPPDSLQQALPDFFWLNEVFPGYVVHFLRKDKQYKLFRNEAFWHQLALQTPEPIDQAFAQLYLLSYATDSIEYLYEDWRIPCGPNDSLLCSTLGSGLHSLILQKMDSIQSDTRFFEDELQQLKYRLLKDLLNNPYFWHSKAEVIRELKKIIQKNGPVLSKSDRVSLSERLQRLEALPAQDKAFHHLEQ
jgi:hypothetical protein